MRITEVLRGKGDARVVTVSSSDTVVRLLAVLAEHRIGAAVVSDDGTTITGIVSERDIVRALNNRSETLSATVGDIMTREVHTCTAATEVEELAALMTQHRFRHVPVVEGDRLVNLVSIGDVVRFRMDQLQAERDQLVDYIKR